MKTILQWKALIQTSAYNKIFESLYGSNATYQRARWADLLDTFGNRFGWEREAVLLSVPGRSELAGNHTDHNHGCVIAGAIDLDMIAVASPRQDGVMAMESDGFAPDLVPLAECDAPNKEKFGTSASLIAGMAHGFKTSGFSVGGFDACATSQVLRGSGLSSSAAYEVLIGTILNALYNDGQVDPLTIAKLAQKAENTFFGKPCGLMDQCACAIGGMIAIDFADPTAPQVESLGFDLSGAGYALCIIDTGGNHADLTADYASIPAEMKSVAAYFGGEVLRDVPETRVRENIPALRNALGDRAVLRALHFYDENKRVEQMKNALLGGDLSTYFDGVNASGESSFCYLQNVYTGTNVKEQGLSLALMLAKRALVGVMSAARVHGGGFAGTIQAYVPQERTESFCTALDAVFGEGACRVLHIRPIGATIFSEVEK